ncbi:MULTISPECIES: translation elongation factor Ts [Asticcacaulis]|jgi:elongation factor Ts|uniref:Elongation factor Ts n=2 Tax=Asticcacaulis TaxID=76890 RepID=E8RSL1_ASTEC|nr:MULTISPECIES: translation elongation factor Ts [Asticcacaulis]ADU14482.1 translation elongation factor Ts [Asticcacaulis excentricus CB 48]MDC7696010.1 translation elongation factor Ts [Asticcacaulis currens]BEV12345.1 translation elongation factor Ts [Asticcacaulis sp. DW145]
MAEITAALVKELREKSGAGMMDCKKALSENDGNVEASMDWLRTKGLSKAAKKADRVAAEGLVAVASSGTTAVAVEVNAETDFVSRNELFQNLARNAAQAGLAAADVEGVQAAINDEITNLIANIGENMVARRMAKHSVSQGVVSSYIHNAIAPNLGRIAVLVAVESAGDAEALNDMGRKIAMHIAATQPLSLSSDDLDPAAVERERTVLTEKAREEGKPEAMIAKIVDGQISKFQREVVLLEQPFVMNPDQTVKQLIADTAKALGTDVTVTGFTRLALGEGVEKKVDDFAAEVASMMNQG